MPKPILPCLLLAALGLVACDDPPKDKPRAAADGGTSGAEAAEARRAAEEQLRTRLRMPGDMPLRAVQVWRQQLAGTIAVCGQVNPAGDANDPFIPWVATVTLAGGRAQRTELVLGASNAEASRVYVELVDRCFEGGGPRTAQGIRPMPPLPLDASMVPARPAAVAAPAATAGAPAVASRQVTTSQAHPVNIRNAPGGGGAVVRVVPRASTLRVFGEAPGGWLEVGEDQPFGWVHGSVLDR
ncbi:SH3 domain-containing protein [Dankookia sp. GCM10030260]|uniref:SH3 domain-containing protein n=1 Tax=Dankookia sp. GCM10030260 TaxID=3273390 RepID=UPI00360FAC9C